MKVVIGIVVLVFSLGVGPVVAQDACCAAPKKNERSCSAGAVSNLVVQLKLNADQAAKVQQVCAKYSQGEQTAAGTSNCMAEMSQILTSEQAAKLKAMCQGQGCPMKQAK